MSTSLLYVSSYTTFMHANSLIVVAALMDGSNRFGGHLDHCVVKLGSLPQEDRVREVSLSFDLYAIELANVCLRTDSMITTLIAYTINSGFLLT